MCKRTHGIGWGLPPPLQNREVHHADHSRVSKVFLGGLSDASSHGRRLGSVGVFQTRVQGAEVVDGVNHIYFYF